MKQRSKYSAPVWGDPACSVGTIEDAVFLSTEVQWGSVCFRASGAAAFWTNQSRVYQATKESMILR